MNRNATFYTALYHSMLTPNLFSDVDGNYLGRDFQIHKAAGFDNYSVFSLWDTFRFPSTHIIDHKRTSDFINAFLAHINKVDVSPSGNWPQTKPTR